MRWLIFVSIALVVACQATENKKPKIVENTTVNDSASWVADLDSFIVAVLANDRERVKSYFNFPIATDSMSIWEQALGIYDSVLSKKPFTEKDFDNHYTNLFPEELVNTLSTINTRPLHNNKDAESKEYKRDSTIYKLFVQPDPVIASVLLNLYSETLVKNGFEEPFNAEFSVIYYFRIVGNSVRFDKILMAG